MVDPRGFYDTIGPFAPFSSHYIRDAGVMQGTLGIAMAIAVYRRSWRVGVLGYGLLQFAFHAVNHLADIGDAEPESVGVLDFVGLTLGALTLGWLLMRAVREERTA